MVSNMVFPMGEGSNNNLKKDLQENPSLGVGLQVRTSLLPSLKVHASNKEIKEATFVVFLLDKLRQNLREKDTEF